MIVRQDDTLVCEDCYMDEGGDGAIRPAHRESYMRVQAGTCADCGCVRPEDAVVSGASHPRAKGDSHRGTP